MYEAGSETTQTLGRVGAQMIFSRDLCKRQVLDLKMISMLDETSCSISQMILSWALSLEIEKKNNSRRTHAGVKTVFTSHECTCPVGPDYTVRETGENETDEPSQANPRNMRSDMKGTAVFYGAELLIILSLFFSGSFLLFMRDFPMLVFRAQI